MIENEKKATKSPKTFEFLTYKTERCQDLNCPGFKLRSLQPKVLKCVNYHADFDKRRVPVDQKKKLFLYNNLIIEDNSLFCLNAIEYLYHPIQYKQLACPYNCNKVICPYKHEDEATSRRYFKENFKFDANAYQEMQKTKEELAHQHRKRSAEADSKGSSKDPVGTRSRGCSPKPAIAHPVKKLEGENEEQEEEEKNKYYFNQKLQSPESSTLEFKNHSTIDPNLVATYICAFLNASGGRLLFGVNDDGYVRGIQLKNKDFDEFCVKIDKTTREFSPKVLPSQYEIKKHQVFDSNQFKTKHSSFLVEVIVKKQVPHSHVYTTNNEQCYVRRAASNSHLSHLEYK